MTVLALPTATEPWRNKRQIAEHFGRSTRWVELRMLDGMPYRKEHPTAWPMFRLSEVDAWMAARAQG